MDDLTKYSPRDIHRIMLKRVKIDWINPAIKKGTIAEWSFEYPNGNKTVDIDFSFPMDENNHDERIGRDVVLKNIENKLWRICGQYTLATGDKL